MGGIQLGRPQAEGGRGLKIADNCRQGGSGVCPLRTSSRPPEGQIFFCFESHDCVEIFVLSEFISQNSLNFKYTHGKLKIENELRNTALLCKITFIMTSFYRLQARNYPNISSIRYGAFGFFGGAHTAMFKLSGKNLFVLCLLVKNLSAVSSADRCDF